MKILQNKTALTILLVLDMLFDVAVLSFIYFVLWLATGDLQIVTMGLVSLVSTVYLTMSLRFNYMGLKALYSGKGLVQ